MRNASTLILLLMGTTVPPLARPVFGQERPSHLPLSNTLGDLTGADEIIKQRLKQADDLKRFQKLAQDVLKNREALQKLAQNLAPDELKRLKRKAAEGPSSLLQDPAVKQLLDQMQSEPGKLAFSEEDRNILNRLAEKVAQNPPILPPVAPDVGPAPTSVPQPSAIPNPMVIGPRHVTSPAFQGEIAADSQQQGWLTRQMLRMADGLDRMDANANSESLGNLVRQMASMRAGEGAGLDAALTDRLGFLSSWGSSLSEKMPTIRTNRLTSLFRGMKLPSVSMGRGWSGGSGPRLPSLQRVDGGTVLTVVLWIALLGGTIGVIWKMSAQSRRTRAGILAGEFQLGPWPVEPASIRTREELAKAFEHLALLKLGLQARPFHHHEIGDRLGKRAQRLASVYELAKYGPPSQLVPEADLAAARHDLCCLVGVPSA